MNIGEKIQQFKDIYQTSHSPVPLIMDALRVKRRDYRGECKGLLFDLEANSHDWYTVYENVVKEDYFSYGIDLQSGGTVVDIGANFGSFTAVASRKVGPSGTVLAFEPNPFVFQRLERTIAINKLDNVKARNEAVSGSDGTLNLFLHKRSAVATTFELVDDRSSSGAVCVPVTAASARSVLACVQGRVDLLKIDCEGAEYDILDSLDRESLSQVRQVAMEVHRIPHRSEREIAERLASLGFTVKGSPPILIGFNDTAYPDHP